jgi:hypothetical protein
MWQALGQVTSALTLVAFAIAAVIGLVRRRLISREHQLLAVPKGDRAALVQSLNDSFLIPSLPIDPQRLPDDKAFTLLLEQIRERSRRYYVTSVLVLLLALIAAAIAAFAIYMQKPPVERGGVLRPNGPEADDISHGTSTGAITSGGDTPILVTVDTVKPTAVAETATEPHDDMPNIDKTGEGKIGNAKPMTKTQDEPKISYSGTVAPPTEPASPDSVITTESCKAPCEARFSHLHPSLYEISRVSSDGRTTIKEEQIYPLDTSWPIPLYVHVHFKDESDRPFPGTTITTVILSDSKVPGAAGEVCPWSETACTVVIAGYRVSIQGGNWPPDLSIVVRKIAG